MSFIDFKALEKRLAEGPVRRLVIAECSGEVGTNGGWCEQNGASEVVGGGEERDGVESRAEPHVGVKIGGEGAEPVEA